jgi:hypothetical protein
MPRELEEAALVEGCTRFRVFYRITLPVLIAPFASAALLVFIFNWSDYLIALLLTTKEWRTIPVYMASLSSSMTGQLYGAKTTPHLYIVDPQGKLIYAGAIDSKPTSDKADIKDATNYVNQALGEAFGGRAISAAATRPYGCSIKYKT